MLEDLPVEVLQQITGHLPTASAIVNLSLANKKLHQSIAVEDDGIFRQFVQNRFPSIVTPPFWKDVARTLTSRSRAWDRRAFVARECRAPRDDHWWPARVEPKQKFGFVSVIDSYESWTNGTNGRSVLAIGAAGRLRVRICDEGTTSWRTWRMPDDHLPSNDILDVRLLKPHQRQAGPDEQLVIRRANGEVVFVQSGAGPVETVPGTRYPTDPFLQMTRFATTPNDVDCVDVNQADDPILAVCSTRSIQLFPVGRMNAITQPCNDFQLDQRYSYKHRSRCAKFLSHEILAVSVQGLEGRHSSPIDVYHVTSHGLLLETLGAAQSIYAADGSNSVRHCANAIAPLDATAGLAGRPGEVFLSGWTDGVVRLHDMRTPLVPTAEYFDGVDDGQILSLLPIGHEKFLAGSHHNAILRTFDLRMPGARSYSYLDATALPDPMPNKHTRSVVLDGQAKMPSISRCEREINIFLSLHIPSTRRLWQPLPRRADSRLPRYRGSIYSLSAPSPSSPSVFAGIENYVIQLDFLSTDDATGSRSRFFDFGLGVKDEAPDDILNLSCYERPRLGHESTDAILLRKQVEWPGTSRRKRQTPHRASNGTESNAEPGWDERWRLATYDRRITNGAGWRA